MQGWSLPEARQRCEVDDVHPLLQQGQLAGYARVDAQQNSRVFVAQSAWTNVEIVDEDGSCLIHRPSMTELSDLKIYPVLHAPDAPELLHDRGLAEVFMTTIVRDPEVAALGRSVMKSGDFRHVFLDGNAPGPSIDPHWSIDHDPDSIAFEFVRPYMWMAYDPLPRASSAVMAAASALADRISALRTLLSGGRLVATGTHPSSGQMASIHRAQWLRKNMAIDVANGDLCEGGSKWTVHWTGLLLGRPGPLPAVSLELRFQSIIENKPNFQRSSIAAETQCRYWLEQLVREHPARRPRSKAELLEEARRKWPNLGARGFERGWSSATANDAASAWRIGGRPRKTPAPKSSAPE